jgi:pyruvate/2-oxoglutarate dehydrogenase complex dihydrolipoamide acyltransferase (E2) component
LAEFRLPDLGEGVTEGQVMRLLVKAGETVREDQPIMEVETDKAAVEIPSPYAGVVSAVHVKEKQVVNVGDLMMSFNTGGSTSAAPAAGGSMKTGSSASKPAVRGSGEVAAVVGASAASVARRKPASPFVRAMARELGLDIEGIAGSGPGGRITRADVEAARGGGGGGGGGGNFGAAPGRPAAHPVPASVPPPLVMPFEEPEGDASSDQYGPIVRTALSQARKTIARVMTEAVTTIPHVTDSDDADITDLEHLRKGYATPEQPERRISTLPFVIRAVVRALQRYPIFNASYDESAQTIVYRRYYNIAIGVQTPRGLLAPTIRNADRLSIVQIAQAVSDIASRARTGQFDVNETRGGTYTISNAGAMGGSRYSTPIITPGQVAVLAVGKSRWQAWVVNGEVTPRFIMPFSHSMDHRLIDGALEIAFMRQVIGDLEQPARLLLEQ